MGKVVTHTFYYGNIFDGAKIEDARVLEDVVGIKDGSPQDPIKIGSVIHPKKNKIEKFLGKKITFNLIDYAKGYQYFDVFIDQTTSGTRKKPGRNIKRPADIWKKWRRYQERRQELIVNSREFTEESTHGHWLSSDEELRKTEEYFLQIVPQTMKTIIEVLKNSNDQGQRIAAAYLIQWQSNKKQAVEILLRTLTNDPGQGVHNEATRALLALLNKVSFPKDKIDVVLNLLFDSSSMSINKGLAVTKLLIDRKIINLRKKTKICQRIKQLSQVKQPAIREWAKDILLANKNPSV